MKLYTKPISSPGRTDKFPPPLMRFLRTNPGNRSRGRSRSNSLFLRKKNTTNTIETIEPSSPKVTCMGQVRVTRSSTASADGAPTKCRCCWWIPHTLFCHRKKPCFCSQSFRPNWKCFRVRRKGKGKASKVTEASSFSESSKPNNESERECEREEEKNQNRVNSEAFVSNSSSPSTPPRNALLLMRSKSTPYSSSSLASRFWGSPLKSEETEEPSENQRTSESVSEQEAIKDPKLELKLRFFKELEDSIKERITESEKFRELKRKEETEGDSAIASRPVALTRCKSERARTVQKLDHDKFLSGFTLLPVLVLVMGVSSNLSIFGYSDQLFYRIETSKKWKVN